VRDREREREREGERHRETFQTWPVCAMKKTRNLPFELTKKKESFNVWRPKVLRRGVERKNTSTTPSSQFKSLKLKMETFICF